MFTVLLFVTLIAEKQRPTFEEKLNLLMFPSLIYRLFALWVVRFAVINKVYLTMNKMQIVMPVAFKSCVVVI